MLLSAKVTNGRPIQFRKQVQHSNRKYNHSFRIPKCVCRQKKADRIGLKAKRWFCRIGMKEKSTIRIGSTALWDIGRRHRRRSSRTHWIGQFESQSGTNPGGTHNRVRQVFIHCACLAGTHSHRSVMLPDVHDMLRGKGGSQSSQRRSNQLLLG